MTPFLTGFEPNSYTSQALEVVCPYTIKLPVSTLSKALRARVSVIQLILRTGMANL